MTYDFWTREFVNERLRLSSKSQSYRLFPATKSGRIRSDGVLFLLNQSRRGIDAPLSLLPADLMTPDETVAHFADIGLTLRELQRWTRRPYRPAPHFAINRRTVLYSAELFLAWLSNSSAVPVSVSCGRIAS